VTRRRSDSNDPIGRLQTPALPLGYSTGTELMRHAQNETAPRTGTIAAVGGRYHIRPAPADADSDLCPLCTRRSAMNRLLRLPVALSLIALAACYHATIETGLTPSTVVIDKSWASGWLWGLVPPSTIETASKCPNGVAKVETKHSFLNQLVEGLTLGIYSPMSIKVTCAQSGHASAAPGASEIVV